MKVLWIANVPLGKHSEMLSLVETTLSVLTPIKEPVLARAPIRL